MKLPPNVIQRLCVCQRCSYGWLKRCSGAPALCPACKSPYWNIPRGKLKRGPKGPWKYKK